MARKIIPTVPAGSNIAAAIDVLGDLKRQAKKAEEAAKQYEDECAIRTAIPTGSWQEAEFYKALLTETTRETLDRKAYVEALEKRLRAEAAKNGTLDTVERWLRTKRADLTSFSDITTLKVEAREL